MPKYNRKCPVCGEEYYCCRSCISINSWKNVCCSQECYREYVANIDNTMSPIIIENGVNDMGIILRAGLVGGKTIDITGYDIVLGKFDCSDGQTRVFEDFEYFIVPKDELKAISNQISATAVKSTAKRVEKVVKEDSI